MARILVDLGPLRSSRDFRLLFGGQLVSLAGSQLTVAARTRSGCCTPRPARAR